MPAWIGIVIFVVAVLAIIFIHELGHFLTAKWFGIKVEEFFIGFGPRVWSFRRGETEYGVKAIPAGGYVRIAGMNPYEEPAPEDQARTFGAKPAWQRAIVLVAGSVTHFILAFLLLAFFFGAIGVPSRFSADVAQVEATLEGRPSPAAQAGLRPGDRFVEVDGRPVQDYDEFVEYTRARPGQEIEVVVERDGRRVPLRLTPVLSEVGGERVGRLGVVLSPGEILERERVGPLGAMGRAAAGIGEISVRSVQAMGQVFSPSGLMRIVRQLFGDEPRQIDRARSICRGSSPKSWRT
ncbi:MAG TPA: site-2 protease family protein, partial [Actinomycetota bacterium]|nr:site-2 protease family protein [Actinomycetota bacterium]